MWDNAEDTRYGAIDGDILIRRIYHATDGEEDSERSRAFKLVIQRICSTHYFTFICFDWGVCKSRLKMLPGYKGNRGPKDDDLVSFKKECLKIARDAGNDSVVVRIYNTEADDIIGSIVAEIHRKHTVTIYTFQ